MTYKYSPPFGYGQMRTAAKDHQCSGGDHLIQKGERYQYTRWPAWKDYEADGEIPVLRAEKERRWWVEKLCVPCLTERQADEMADSGHPLQGGT